MTEQSTDTQTIHKALGSLPSSTFVLTCAHDQYRDGLITKWVQRCSDEPPMLVVAIKKGQAIEPMLRDARAFALCMVPNGDRKMIRLFGRSHEPDDDPFLAAPVKTAVTGMPILTQSLAWFDCLLEGHLSPDSDCRLYLGHVVAAHIHPSLLSMKQDAQHAIIEPPVHDGLNTSGKRTAQSKASR